MKTSQRDDKKDASVDDVMRFPGESDEYRAARDQLLEEESALRRQIEAVAAKRRALPMGGEVLVDYPFDELDPRTGTPRRVHLSELFRDDASTLVLYSFMFGPDDEAACPSCTSIIDALDGEAPHIEQRVALAVAAKAPIERFAAHAANRGWRHARLLSSAPSTYNSDYHTEDSAGNQYPIVTVFARRDGRIHHFYSSELFLGPRDEGQHPRHVDAFWPLWQIFDLTPDGRGADWHPKLAYP